MHTISIRDLDVIFISYDEPNAEFNWADLSNKIPWALRVHGVKGSDAAHKAAANLSSTDRFITIDGDNYVFDAEGFLDQIISIDESQDMDKTVISWPSNNHINGLLYGNGGIKCWPKKAVLEMKTHEAAAPDNIKAQVDFCWELNYLAIDKCFSTIINNASKKQAWRAGFREGIKMCLNDSVPVPDLRHIHPPNLKRLKMWMTIGADMQHGLYSIFGAIHGCYTLRFTKWDYVKVRDFDELDKLWAEQVSYLNEERLHEQMAMMLDEINLETFVPRYFSSEHSKLIKELDFNSARQLPMISSDFGEYDIVMITYGEYEAEENWNRLKTRFPRAKRVNGVKGIHAAHKAAAKLCRSEMFWVVDGDAQVYDNFNFDYIVPKSQRDTVHVWRAKNPVNGLEYGYGGIKLLPRQMTLDMDITSIDMTTSISRKYKPVMECASITAFNSNPGATWRSAFREAAKLAGSLIKNQDPLTSQRLKIWMTIGTGNFGQYSISGAHAGKNFIEQNPDKAHMLNDFDFLHQLFLNRESNERL